MTAKTTILTAIVAPLLLTACGDRQPIAEDEQARGPAQRPVEVMEDVPARPVRIGEGGPRFDACQAVGRARDLRGGVLPIRNAPFDAAEQTGSIEEGARVFICTRSIDQQWLGVVIPREDGPECGVSSPVRNKQNYDGPCDSGWVESNFIQLIAG